MSYGMPGLDGDYSEDMESSGRYTPFANKQVLPGNSGFLNQQWRRFGPSGRAAAMIGAAGGLMSMLGRRSGPSREEIEQEALARSGMGLADQFGGEMGSMGMGLQNSGRSMLERGRSGYLSSMFDPSIATGQRAQLASDLSSAQRGVAGQVGLMGGPLAGARFARNASAYNPNFAAGSVQIGNNATQRRGQGFQSMANFGQQDFNQGLGLRNQGFGIQSQGRQNLGATLGRLDAARQARRAQQQAAIGGLFKAAGSASTGGLF
jgi:hypothetical protein